MGVKRYQISLITSSKQRSNPVKCKLYHTFVVEKHPQNTRTFFYRRYDVQQAHSQSFWWGSAYVKNPDQIINVGMIGHANSEDTGILGGSGSMLP